MGQFLHVRGFSLKWLKIRKIWQNNGKLSKNMVFHQIFNQISLFSWKIPFSPNFFFAKLLGPELFFFSKMEQKHARSPSFPAFSTILNKLEFFKGFLEYFFLQVGKFLIFQQLFLDDMKYIFSKILTNSLMTGNEKT